MRKLLETALAAADAAARVHVEHAGRFRIEDARAKRGSDYVSLVDLEAQRAALGCIRSAFPSHRILAEEEDGPESGLVFDPADDLPTWIVDPLDGTTNYLHGHPAYAASVGVVRGHELLAGAVVCASTGERWWALRGEGAFRNGKQIRVSRTRELAPALIGTGFPFKHPEHLDAYLEQFRRVLGSTSGIRRGGAAALDLCYLAQGTLDGFWEIHLSPWDIAGGLCILTEAGGIARSLEGGPLDPMVGGGVLAANSPEFLESLGRLVRGR
jgi:myo-inositol-1(or 4)-monophosphatase